MSEIVLNKMQVIKPLLFTILIFCSALTINAQTEVEPWGNITGIRIEGELMEFETAICVVQDDWKKVKATGQEKQRPKYMRNSATQTIQTKIDSFYLKEDVKENMPEHSAQVNLHYTSASNAEDGQLYYRIALPAVYYGDGKIHIAGNADSSVNLPVASIGNKTVEAKEIHALSLQRQLKIQLQSAAAITFKKQDDNIYMYIPVSTTKQEGDVLFNITASGKINKEPVAITLNTKDTGSMFAGFGGNFRLQNPRHDPQVIDYCLNNVRVAYGRVEMPWMLWQPDENSNPVDSAKAGKLHAHVKESMEMAQRLSKMNIPVILSAWFPPQWAVTGTLNMHHKDGDEWGNALDQSKAQKIYQSISDYINYLKEAYGVDIKMFSFNESDLGINVRQTGEEHATLIKGLGAYMQQHGLATKMLLGDNSDATTYSFIYPAIKDAATHPYIGAISFHSWRGWSDSILQKWKDAATQLQLPLIVGEGSIDAAAWNYPQIFQEPVYALKEINLYTRLMAICQPLSILQWQLTSDYSPLIGGGIFGNNDSLHPGQRFYNLKQLASVPENLYAMPVHTKALFITCAAQGDNQRNTYAIHIVNNGATRSATIEGLPSSLRNIKVYITNSKDYMRETEPLKMINNKLNLTLQQDSYITVICSR